MNRPMLHALAFVTAALTTMACGAASDDGAEASMGAATAAAPESRDVRESENAAHSMLASLMGLKSASLAEGATARVYSVMGAQAADPDRVWLAIDGSDHQTPIWDLGMKAVSISKVEAAGRGSLRISGTELDASDKEVPFTATVRYTLEGAASDAVTVEKAGVTQTVKADSSASAAGLAVVIGLKDIRANGIRARLYEIGGGDPALNGDQLVLNLADHPDYVTFDLGLNVASVTTFGSPRLGNLQIAGSEDFMDENGDVGHRPFAVEVQFAASPGTVPSGVTVARKR